MGQKVSTTTPDYGIDAPGVVRALGLSGLAGVLIALLLVVSGLARSALWAFAANWALWAGLSTLVAAGLMLWSSKLGKIWECRRVLNSMPWRGDEIVLDLGCGRGLFLIEAAKHLTTGKAIGIDIWRGQDQSGNSPQAVQANALAEGVADRVKLYTADARRLPLPDASVDVVLSSLLLHNLPTDADRERALQEIVRVLKPGGRVALLDIRYAPLYARLLQQYGMVDVHRSGPRLLIFPPASLVTARKPSGNEVSPVMNMT